MSKIAIIGATGRAGSQLLEEALRRGHRVLAIARDPSTLEGREGVTVKSLDATDSAALQAAVAGMDAVLSAAHFSTMEPHAIIEPVKRAGVKRLLVVGGAGSLLLPSGHRVIDSPDFPEAYKAEASAGVRFWRRCGAGRTWTGPSFRLRLSSLRVSAEVTIRWARIIC